MTASHCIHKKPPLILAQLYSVSTIQDRVHSFFTRIGTRLRYFFSAENRCYSRIIKKKKTRNVMIRFPNDFHIQNRLNFTNKVRMYVYDVH